MITQTPDLDGMILAGRRAAYGELHALALRLGTSVAGQTYEDYNGGNITVNGVDFLPLIDAVTLEAIVHRVEAPKPRRKWWRFWS